MGGPSKRRRADGENLGKNPSSSGESGSRSTPKSIPRLDGNKDPIITKPGRNAVDYSQANDLKNISEALGMAGWFTARGESVGNRIPDRPAAFNKNGKPTSLILNTFNVEKMPTTIVHQYDVAWGSTTDGTKRVLIKKIWNSKAVQAALGGDKARWIYDGNKLAWCGVKLDRPETRITVDLDDEENQKLIASGKPARKAKEGKDNKHTIYIRYTRMVDFMHLQLFLDKKAAYSNECIDIINFLDHLMREGPGRRLTQIKKNFFERNDARADLGEGVEAVKGVFASMRPVLKDNLQKGMAINVDVANGTFWRAQELGRSLTQVFGCTPQQIQQRFREAKKDWKKSFFKADLRRYKRVGVTATHIKGNPTQWTIDEFVGEDATEVKFTNADGRTMTIADYFKEKYNVNVMPGIPVVKMTKKFKGTPVFLPVDVLRIDANQRYNTKLSDKQTSNMIRFAVTVPKDRWAAVENGLRLLDWQKDPYLQHYGIQISSKPSKVPAIILSPPVVSFGTGSRDANIKPHDMLQGRWRLDGRKFVLANNERPIKSWGICVVQGRGAPQPQAIQRFAEEFVRVYESHGGKVMAHPKFGKTPWMGPGNLADGGELVAKAFTQTGNRYQLRPNLMFFIVNDRNIEIYRRIKKSCDIRFGVASQVIQSKHAQQASAQYLSNVCMKVNAKLGGATSAAKSSIIPRLNPTAGSTPTMVVGADVSHPAPGSMSAEAASFAAITVSADALFCRYWADVQTNGHRIEMITTSNIENHFAPMIKKWMQGVGKGLPPKRVLYVRDGVSEGQYAAVINEEVRDMKEAFMKVGCKDVPDFTVVIAGKRHHIRFFLGSAGDRNQNPLPGTLVESGCTHPHEFDFYLNSHVAIKGTSRPIHYQCILNENGKWQGAELQQFLFEHSYQYMRSTTPVSMFPAVYYAHLAADRARAHVSDSPVSSGKKEAKAKVDQKSSTGSSKREIEVSPLQAMTNIAGLKDVMWFI